MPLATEENNRLTKYRKEASQFQTRLINKIKHMLCHQYLRWNHKISVERCDRGRLFRDRWVRPEIANSWALWGSVLLNDSRTPHPTVGQPPKTFHGCT